MKNRFIFFCALSSSCFAFGVIDEWCWDVNKIKKLEYVDKFTKCPHGVEKDAYVEYVLLHKRFENLFLAIRRKTSEKTGVTYEQFYCNRFGKQFYSEFSKTLLSPIEKKEEELKADFNVLADKV